MSSTEDAGLGALRRELLADATGAVLEVGAGTGVNLAHYPATVEHLTLTEPDPFMLRRLEHAASRSGRDVTVLRAPAEDLPFEDDTFDTVVCTLVLCGVDDQPRAIREIRRVLAPHGQLLLVEHVRADDEVAARRQDRFNWVGRMFSACDCNRPTGRELEGAGFELAGITHGELPRAPSLVRPMISGSVTPSPVVRH